jgi:hypothetical protein
MDTIPPYPYSELLNEVCKSLIGEKIEVSASFMGITIRIIDVNMVGTILENVLFPTLKARLGFREGPNKNAPTDFFGDKTGNFRFELKVFLVSPGFDLANFASYIDQLCAENGVFDKLFRTKYIVFEYAMENQSIVIKNFHYLNIWQFPCFTASRPLSVQVKRGVWHNIRSGTVKGWSDKSKTPALFIDKIIESIIMCPQIVNKDDKCTNIRKQWTDISSKYAL